MNRPSRPRILSIAGTDPTGGAGIQADLKSIAAAGGYGMSVITALVAQNTHGVSSIHTPPLSFLRDQLESVFSDVSVDAVKLGMLGSAPTVELVSDWLFTHEHGPVVLDPVMVATSGDRLLDADAEEAVRGFATEVDVVTPNLAELAVLVGRSVARDFDEAVAQAAEFAEATGTIVIVKGGHLTGPMASNAVVRRGSPVHLVPNHRVDTGNTHGTGCSLSSALTTRLGAGQPVERALEWATRWLRLALRGAGDLQVGSGNGPVDHSAMTGRMLAAADPTPWPHLYGDPLAAPAVASPRPRITPAGPFTESLWAAAGDIIAEITSGPFIRGLGDGSLSREEFLTYIEQDAHYLTEYARALALLAAQAPDPESQVAWSSCATECLVGEAELHRGYLTDRPGTTAASPVTMAYTDFLLARTSLEDYAVGAAAVLPCFWLYAEIGLWLAEHNRPDHPYRAWLQTYSDAEFIAGTAAALQRVERACTSASALQRERAARAFLGAAVHEKEFFDQATRSGWV